MESSGSGQDGAALGDHVVDQHDSLGSDAGRIRHRQRLVMLLCGWTISVEGGGGLPDRETALHAGPN